MEHKEYAEAYSAETQKAEEKETVQTCLKKVLDRDNLNRAYRRVKANKGASGVDGMTVDEALPWLKEHREELLESIRNGKYKPSPVRRVEIQKDNGGVRKLGIPTVIDRIIQQAIAQVLTPIYEPKFFGRKLRLQTAQKRKGCNTQSEGVCGRGVPICRMP
ncbi:MAG: hypothetical protein L6V84_08065 [Oscillospiraceae bacterium]|nr:MAG: hypothetical protein L6V84_08065 [Oscillospiraceae bacterium]